jgi:hypothetical protein
MSSRSNSTSYICKGKVESEVMGSRPMGCVCDLLIKKRLKYSDFFFFFFPIMNFGYYFWEIMHV